ncbi:MAG: hypothetical protein WD934_05685 [Gemmatimonadales bacterium]
MGAETGGWFYVETDQRKAISGSLNMNVNVVFERANAIYSFNPALTFHGSDRIKVSYWIGR